jgi:beta-glucosidase
MALVDVAPERGDAIAATDTGAWASFGSTDLSGCGHAVVTLAGAAGTVTLRADDPLDGDVLAVFPTGGSGRYDYRSVRGELAPTGLTELYLVCDAAGIIISEVSFA